MLNLPQRRPLRQIQVERQKVPVEQIIAVMGDSSAARGIQAAGDVLSAAITKRAETKRNAAQVSKLEKIAGQEPGAFLSLDPSTAASFAGSVIKQKADAAANNYTPAQVDAIVSGDPAKLAANFPNGVPNQAMSAMGSASSRSATDAERLSRDADRDADRSARAEERELRRIEKEERNLNSNVQDYSGMLEKTNIPSAISVADDVIRLLPAPGVNIPGFGPVASKVPGLLIGGDGQRMRQAVGKMMNIELKDRSGVALRDEEIERLKSEFGSGTWSTEQQLRDGVSAYVNRLNEIATNVVASAPQDAVSEYQRRGGRDIKATFGGLVNTAKQKSLKPLPVGPKKQGRFTVEEVK